MERLGGCGTQKSVWGGNEERQRSGEKDVGGDVCGRSLGDGGDEMGNVLGWIQEWMDGWTERGMGGD